MKTSKAATKRAIKALPALRTSLIWFKRETIRTLRARARDAASPLMQATLWSKVRKIAETDLADLRNAYECDRVSEIRRAPRFELTRAVPNITWMTA